MRAFGNEDFKLAQKDKTFASIMTAVSELVFESRKSRSGVYGMASKNPQIKQLLDALMQTGPERRCCILRACLSSSFEE